MIKISLKSAIAFLLMASASLVGAQTLQTLFSFSNTNGANPEAGLTLGNDGNFYGTTSLGGVGSQPGGLSGWGTVFKVATNGALTTLVFYDGSVNGSRPRAALTLDTDSNFYGTTSGGGTNGYGTVFRMTTNGTLTTLVSFSFTNGGSPNALTLGKDGIFYGTTSHGGSGNYGTVFKITTNGTLTSLVDFDSNTNGATPYAGLTLGNDGSFYGTAPFGGSNGIGTVFQVTTNGTLTSLISFDYSNGARPYAGLTLGNDGNFYGTTYFGGSDGYGTVFRLLLPPVIIVQPQSQTNNAGATVTFLVNATSLHPMSFRWQKNGTNVVNGGNISGATTNALIITGISESDTASFSIIVCNSNGCVTNYATLTVIAPPALAVQLSSGSPLLSLYGMLSNNFVVQYSSDLADTNWMHLLSITNLSSSPYQFLDPGGVEQPARFYRAFMQ